MGKRTQSHEIALVPIADLGAADAALAELGEIKRALGEVEAHMNEEIDKLKTAAAEVAAPLVARQAALGAGLNAFAEYTKEELFAKAKTLDLTHGSLGYRKSTKLGRLAKTTWDMVLGALVELGFDDAIRVKKEVNKEELLTWPDERLTLVGAKREIDDVFWYEVKEEELGRDAA